MLRQSIIHVEHDNIDFDEEELAGERPREPATAEDADAEGDEDVEMSGVIEESQEDESQPQTVGGSSTGAVAATSSSQQQGAAPQPAAAPAKRKMVITHDKYMTLQSMIVMHLSHIENETGKGVDRDELIDWYLESKEEEVQDVEELEYEKELMTKMLRRLVKVCLLLRCSCVQKLSSLIQGQLSS